jgi:hypothetical protein
LRKVLVKIIVKNYRLRFKNSTKQEVTTNYFSQLKKSGVVTGNFKVTRGTNPIAKLIAMVAGLPPASENTPIKVTSSNNVWTREFGTSHKLVSQWAVSNSHGLVEERFLGGLAKIGFQLKPFYKEGKMAVKIIFNLKKKKLIFFCRDSVISINHFGLWASLFMDSVQMESV